MKYIKYCLAISFLSVQFFITANKEDEKIKSEQLKKQLIENATLLNQYPELIQEIFGTNDINKLGTKEDFSVKFKKILSEGKQAGKIIIASIIAAVAYGIIQDQITARICLQYFSEGFHKNMLNNWNAPVLSQLRTVLQRSNSPTVYAFIWGTVATWWVGALLGIPLSVACRAGNWPKLELNKIIKPIGCVLAGMGVSSFLSGFYAYMKYRNDPNAIQDFCDYNITGMVGVTENNRLGFIVNSYAHSMAYLSGVIGGISCIGYALYKRKLKKDEQRQKAQAQLLSLISKFKK